MKYKSQEIGGGYVYRCGDCVGDEKGLVDEEPDEEGEETDF